MQLTFKPFDGRRHDHVYVVDEDTGQTVGYIQSYGVGFGNSGGIDVSLFDGKYRAHLNRYEECVGFVRGVQSVLNHMVRLPTKARQEVAA